LEAAIFLGKTWNLSKNSVIQSGERDADKYRGPSPFGFAQGQDNDKLANGVGRSLRRFSGALRRKGVRSFRNDDPEEEIRHGADAGKQGHERCDDADDVDVPSIVESKPGADSGDHAVVAGARELVGVRVDAGRRRRGGDGSSAGGTEAGGWVDWFAAL
jgi:hypothetical protein